jgi:ribonuclease VapC
VIVDSSALLAVLLSEPDEDLYLDAMIAAEHARISAANWVETTIILDARRNPAASYLFEDLADSLRLEVVPVDEEMAYRARRAYSEFGRGRHSARLNFADCFSYALAAIWKEPLLFKGNDFSQTDIEPALKG